MTKKGQSWIEWSFPQNTELLLAYTGIIVDLGRSVKPASAARKRRQPMTPSSANGKLCAPVAAPLTDVRFDSRDRGVGGGGGGRGLVPHNILGIIKS